MPNNRLPEFIQAARSFHDRIYNIYEACVYPRGNSELDSVLLSLVNRTLNALKSLVMLSESQYAADANVLTRVIVEIWIVVRWITNKDSFNRDRKFTQFEAKGIERTMEVLITHDPTVLIPQNPNQEIITEAASLYSSHVHWAGTTKSMAEETEEVDSSFTDLIYFYEVPYFMTSWYVHSNVMVAAGVEWSRLPTITVIANFRSSLFMDRPLAESFKFIFLCRGDERGMEAAAAPCVPFRAQLSLRSAAVAFCTTE